MKDGWIRIAILLLSGMFLAVVMVLLLEPFSWSTAHSALPRVDSDEVMSTINIFQAAVLGLVQGLTEFLPISSTAHLKAVPVALGWGDPGSAFSAAIQLGSIVAVLSYFWRDLTQISRGTIDAVVSSDYHTQEFRLAMGIALGTLPILVVGCLITVFIPNFDRSPLRSMGAIAIASIIMGLLLGMSERLGQHQRQLEKLSLQDSISMGIAQAMAAIPGVSRSGSTLTAGLFLGLDRTTAARFSFLLGIPAITLAGLVKLKEALGEGLSAGNLMPLIVGILSSAIFSYVAIAGLLRYLQTKNTWVFVWYRLAFGIAILGSIVLGWVKN